MEAAKLLSLVCLCRQNLGKNRKETANMIFRELIAHLQGHLKSSDGRVLS
jgi:hypothetical protein